MSRALAALAFLPLLAGMSLPHARGVCTDSYTVMRGDTLYSIARLCRSSVGAMARANRLADARTIEVGQRLIVPGRSASVPAFHQEVKEVPAPPAVRDLPALAQTRGARGYRMERGDTLYSLARWARVSVSALLVANPEIDPAKIEIGARIALPAGAAEPRFARARERGLALPATVSRPAARRVRARREAPAPRPADEVEDPRRGPVGM